MSTTHPTGSDTSDSKIQEPEPPKLPQKSGHPLLAVVFGLVLIFFVIMLFGWLLDNPLRQTLMQQEISPYTQPLPPEMQPFTNRIEMKFVSYTGGEV